jgi:hypothetical protein
MVIVTIDVNNDANVYPGDYIADAVRFISSGTGQSVDITVDDAQPASYPSTDNAPWPIFSTQGFFTNDEVARNYEDMSDEPGNNGSSKVPFYFTCACQINNYIFSHPSTTDKNIGNLYALGQSGLICMGVATDTWPDIEQTTFANVIKSGADFGEAFLAQQNAHWYHSIYDPSSFIAYCLLGAGTLRAQPYVQYGSDVEEYQTITTTQTLSKNSPILIDNISVNGSGNWTVTSTHNSSSPFGTYSEVVIRPECDFAPTGTRVVDIKVN